MRHFIDNIATSIGTVVDGVIEYDFRSTRPERSTGYPGEIEITYVAVLWVEVVDEDDNLTKIEDVPEALASEILGEIKLWDMIDVG